MTKLAKLNEDGSFEATKTLQDMILYYKKDHKLTWRSMSSRIGNISPEFLGNIARGTSSYKMKKATVDRITSFFNDETKNNSLKDVSTDDLLAEIKRRLNN